MRKRVLSILLVLCMVLSLLPGMARAAESSKVVPLADTMTYGNLSYIVKDGAIEITACDESATNVDIPAQIDGVPVTSIRVHAFYEHRKLNRITIPNGVTYIGGEVFQNCSNLTSVILPAGVTSIEMG